MLKSIVTRAKEIYIKEMFIPGLLGLFINPYYFSRKGLYNGIKSNKHYLKGKLLDFGCGAKPYMTLIDVENYILQGCPKLFEQRSLKLLQLPEEVFCQLSTLPWESNLDTPEVCYEYDKIPFIFV